MRFGLPKNKNLKEMVNELFADVGISVGQAAPRIDYTDVTGDFFEGTGCALKQKTLTDWVAQGRLDGGIVGYDYAMEFNARAEAVGAPTVEVIEYLDIARCELQMAVANDSPVRKVSDLEGLRVATSYAGILREYLQSRNVNGVEIVEMDGSVEMAIALGEADAILDVVETGSSLRANGLKSIWGVMSSQAVVIAPEKSTRDRQGSNFEAVRLMGQQLTRPSAMRAVG